MLHHHPAASSRFTGSQRSSPALLSRLYYHDTSTKAPQLRQFAPQLGPQRGFRGCRPLYVDIEEDDEEIGKLSVDNDTSAVEDSENDHAGHAEESSEEGD